MDANAAPSVNERQVQVAALVRAKLAPDKRATVDGLVDRYFDQVDPGDLAEREPADLYGAMLSHWNFAHRREPGRPKIRAFNPTLEEHGWQSTHTIIEIVNDDMPFLVDSVTMEANRHGLTLHLIIHPVLAVARDARRAMRVACSNASRRKTKRRTANRSSMSRSIGSPIPRVSMRSPPTWPVSSATSAWPSPTGRRCANACSRSSPSWMSGRRP